MSDIYCKQILTKQIPFKLFAESDQVLAFYHTKPFWPIHIVVIPKAHVVSLLDIKKEQMTLIQEIIIMIQNVARHITTKYGACRVLTNLGNYQDSGHLFWHISFGKPIQP